MRCSRVRKLLTDEHDVAFPAAVREHLAACPGCRVFRERTAAVRRLLALKRYEQPTAGFDERCRYAVRQALAEELERERMPAPAGAFGLGRAADAALPALRYALAAVLMAMVAMHLFLAPSLPPMHSLLPNDAPAVRLACDEPLPVTNLAMEVVRRPAVPEIVLASNRGPAGVRYGPGGSRLVSFDY